MSGHVRADVCRVGEDLPYAIEQEPVGERRVLLDRVPPKTEVLDVGCWGGFAGRYLMQARAATVDGVEPSGLPASVARRTYRRVLPVPIERALPELRGEGARYDVVLFLDVLEHLVDPRAVLEAARDIVRPGGSALVSMPNVAHWSVRKELLRGRWEYTDSGLLDRTHLRFFTLETARQTLRSSGWEVTWESCSLGQPPLIRLPTAVLARLARWPSMFAVQFLFEAVCIAATDP
jgi:2-polyprenyl-3-methyl-5-hydroxy-6-metoxy-1,4-benzoquinol methylase